MKNDYPILQNAITALRWLVVNPDHESKILQYYIDGKWVSTPHVYATDRDMLELNKE